ncbi:alpha/beta hydrolase family protein [Marinicaulis aureus]|uniref:Alpha/beta hydrolase family protein n=1 Tax=Hyphococcus aureus TaxID=2666033 RepID=A0ABW1KUQ3_9PROT
MLMFTRIALIGAGAVLQAACVTGGQDAAIAGNPVIRDPAAIDPDYPPAIMELGVDSHGKRMNGHIYIADGPGPHPTVVMLHGFPGNEKNLDLAQAIRRAGWNALFIHYRGAWGSEGVYSFANGIEDVASALAFLRDPANADLRVDPDHLALVGHSMGGFFALQGGARDETLSCIVGIAAANLGDRADLAGASPEQLEDFKRYSDDTVMLNGFNGDTAIAELAAAGDSFDNTLLAPKFKGKHMLLIAGERDEAVNIAVHDRHMAAYSAVPEIDLAEWRVDADHSFSWSRIALAEKVTSWLNETCR